jgi:hypothetical protein
MIPVEEIDYASLRGTRWLHMSDKYPYIDFQSDYSPFIRLFALVRIINNSIIV